jgi:transmembrane sensor
MWSRVRARTVDAGDYRGTRPPSTPRAMRTPLWVYAYAATVTVCVAAATLFVRARDRASVAARDSAPGEYRTSRAQYATIRLADSTEVTLAPESRLTIAAHFGDGAREIALEGEAIFSVRHDAAHPFRVRARGALIEDVGTKFDVRAYPGDADVTVAVAEGSVVIRRDDRGHAGEADSARAGSTAATGIVFERGAVATLDPRGKVSAEPGTSAASYLVWASGRLSFADRPLMEVLRTIGRWYDLDIRVADARLAQRVVNAEFSTQAPSEMIDALAIATDATVERAGRVVTLRAR